MCTKLDTINTGINIDTVNESNLKFHKTYSDSTSTHLATFIVTGILLKPTSKKAKIAKNVVVITDAHVIKCAPLTPTFLPKKPETIEPNKGKIINVKYIIYIVLIYYLLIYNMQLKFLNLLQILLLLLL